MACLQRQKCIEMYTAGGVKPGMSLEKHKKQEYFFIWKSKSQQLFVCDLGTIFVFMPAGTGHIKITLQRVFHMLHFTQRHQEDLNHICIYRGRYSYAALLYFTVLQMVFNLRLQAEKADR